MYPKTIMRATRLKIFVVCSLVLVIILGGTSCYGQTKSDSIRAIWENEEESHDNRFAAFEAYYQLHVLSEPKRIIESSDPHFTLAQKVESKHEMLLALGNKAQSLSMIWDNKQSIEVLKKGYEIAKKYDDSLSMASNRVNRGIIHVMRGDYEQAVDNYRKGLAIFEKKDMLEQQAKILNNLGLIFFEITDFESAHIYFKRSLKILEELDTAESSGYIWLSIAAAQFELNLEKKAMHSNEKALEILEKQNDKISLSICHSLFARMYEKNDEIEKAVQSIKNSIRISEEIENASSTIEYKVSLARLTLTENLDGATEVAEEALSFINTSDEVDLSLKKDVYDLLYKCYKAKGESEISLNLLEKYTLYSDSLDAENRNFDIIKVTIRDEYEKQLSEQKNNNQKEQLKLIRSQSNQLIVIVSIAFVVLLSLFLFFRRRNAENKREKTSLLEEIETLKANRKNDEPISDAVGFRLDRIKIESAIGRKINETDWNVLNILLDDPVISNKDIAAKAFLSVDGIGSSLRRMYEFFEIKESKYKKISLLLEAVKISNLKEQ